MLDTVHEAIDVLLQINDDPTHLFGYRLWPTSKPRLANKLTERLGGFRDHVNDLFGTQSSDGVAEPFIPADGDQQWVFTTRQFRRSLAWHIAHQPFGVVAGARQYHHAKVTMFEGYAGTSASGFAAEDAAEEAVATLDYVEDLYRDWNTGAQSGGGAAERINAEFQRIRRELGDLPGVVTDELRLRTMLRHLTIIRLMGGLPFVVERGHAACLAWSSPGARSRWACSGFGGAHPATTFVIRFRRVWRSQANPRRGWMGHVDRGAGSIWGT